MRLRALQLAMQNALLDESEQGVRAIAHVIVDTAPLAPAARLEIYRNAYRSRLIEALEDGYPNLHRLLGDEHFDTLGAGFVAAHSSVHRSIRWYGRELAQFLRAEPAYRDQPRLAELAAFEWTLGEAFDSEDAIPLERAALNAIEPAAWGEMHFSFHPSLRRLALEWNTVAAWRALGEEGTPPDPARLAHPTSWLIWRQGLKNYFRSLEPIEERALEAAQAGARFAQLCTTLAATVGEAEIALHAARLVATWVDGGLIVSVSTG